MYHFLCYSVKTTDKGPIYSYLLVSSNSGELVEKVQRKNRVVPIVQNITIHCYSHLTIITVLNHSNHWCIFCWKFFLAQLFSQKSLVRSLNSHFSLKKNFAGTFLSASGKFARTLPDFTSKECSITCNFSQKMIITWKGSIKLNLLTIQIGSVN